MSERLSAKRAYKLYKSTYDLDAVANILDIPKQRVIHLLKTHYPHMLG